MRRDKRNDRSRLDRIWKLSLLTFILAGLTGSMFRFGLTGWIPDWLALENIRHAHSHLMFFSWAVPAPLYVVLRLGYADGLPLTVVHRLRRWVQAIILLGLAAFPFFLFYGYRSVPIAGSALPFSVMLSGLVMISWYGFSLEWIRWRSKVKTDLSVRFFDAALLLLLVASLGAWGVAGTQFLQIENPLYGKALTHFFLAIFTEGWCIAVLLGVFYRFANLDRSDLPFSPGWLIYPILFGAPLTFPYGISEMLMTGEMSVAARVGGGLAAAGLILNIYILVRYGRFNRKLLWMIPIWLLALKAVIQLSASLLPGSFWMSDQPLRIFYLHLLLLGGFTLTMMAAFHQDTRTKSMPYYLFGGSVLLVLISLLMLTRFWPGSMRRMDPYFLAAIISVAPVIAAAIELFYLSKVKTH